jgi:hypothetical protein
MNDHYNEIPYTIEMIQNTINFIDKSIDNSIDNFCNIFIFYVDYIEFADYIF